MKITFLSLFFSISAGFAAELPEDTQMSYLENGIVRAGIDLHRGGAIVYFARWGETNLINNYDRGRQAQLSFYSGPVPFVSPDGQRPKTHWSHLGWNPVQAGDDFGRRPEILSHKNDGRTIHVRCRPLQWPLDGVPGDCVFDTRLELEGAALKVRARLENARIDRAVYPARLQELPAVYANGAFPRVVSYTGAGPFSGEAATVVPKARGGHPWTFWVGTEGWVALLDERDRGLGLITPGRIFFTGGFAGSPGVNDTRAGATAYVAGQGQELLDADIVFDYRFELVAGSLEEIRARAAEHRPAGLPVWEFASDRRHWHVANASAGSWPVAGFLEAGFEKDDPQLISPHVFWRAEEAPWLEIEAAFRTKQKRAAVFWQPFGREAPGADDRLEFPIEGDGEFRRYVVRLADSPGYRGAQVRLRIDPVPAAEPEGRVKVRSIRLLSERR